MQFFEWPLQRICNSHILDHLPCKAKSVFAIAFQASCISFVGNFSLKSILLLSCCNSSAGMLSYRRKKRQNLRFGQKKKQFFDQRTFLASVQKLQNYCFYLSGSRKKGFCKDTFTTLLASLKKIDAKCFQIIGHQITMRPLRFPRFLKLR